MWTDYELMRSSLDSGIRRNDVGVDIFWPIAVIVCLIQERLFLRPCDELRLLPGWWSVFSARLCWVRNACLAFGGVRWPSRCTPVPVGCHSGTRWRLPLPMRSTRYIGSHQAIFL